MSDSSTAAESALASTGTVSALERGIAVLRCFTEDVASLSNTELSLRTGVPKPTVTRLAATLCVLGLLRQDPATERFSLAAGVVPLARAFLANLDVRAVARPYMAALAERFSGSTYLAVCDGLDMVLVEIQRARQAGLRSTHEIGTRIPLAGSALGRAFLCQLAQTDPAAHAQRLRELEYAEGAGFKQVSQGLKAAAADFRDAGVCLALATVNPQIHSIAVAVRTPTGEPMALNFGGPAFVFTERILRDEVAPALREAAAGIERDMLGE